MIQNHKGTFIMAESGCMHTEENSLESIAAGHDNGADGCCLHFDLTKDCIPILGKDGKVTASDGAITLLSNFTFDELRPFCKRLVTAGQAIDLAKSYAYQIAFRVSTPKIIPFVRIALKYSEYLSRAYMLCGASKDTLELIQRYPDLNFMLDVPSLSGNVNELLLFVKDSGFYGIQIRPEEADSSFVAKAQRLGLCVSSAPTDDEFHLRRMVDMNINYIHTSRPDIASLFMPVGDNAPEGNH